MARKIILSLILVLTSVFLALSSCLNVFAADVSLNAVPIWSNYTPDMSCWQNAGSHGNNECVNTNSDITVSVSQLGFSIPNGLNITAGKTIAQVQILFDNFQENNSIDGNFLSARTNVNATSSSNNYANFGLIDIKSEAQGSTGYRITMTFLAENTTTGGMWLYILNPYNNNELAYLKPGERITPSYIGFFNLVGDDSQAIVNAINNNNSTTAINDAKREIVSAIEEQQSSQEEIYQDEKDTINDNGDTAQDSAGDLSFDGFSVGNPLLNWIALFTDNTCVSIPTIADWIHSNETQVCSPWSSSVRGVTTPIITVLSGTILFGFIVHWLKQKDGQELS